MNPQSIPILALALVASCAAPTADVIPNLGLFEVDGDLGISSLGATAGTDLETAGLGDGEPGGGARVDFKMGTPHLSLSSHLSRHQGSGTTTGTLSDGGVTIGPSSTVRTDLNLGIYSGALTFDVIPGDFELGLGFGVAGIEVDGDFTEVGSGNVVATDQVLPIPLLAARAAIEWGDFELAALLSGADLTLDGDELGLLDLDVYGRWRIVGGEDRLRVSAILGYRYVDFDLRYEEATEDVTADFTLSGPYLGLGLSL